MNYHRNLVFGNINHCCRPSSLPLTVACGCCLSLLPIAVSANFLHVQMEACGQEVWEWEHGDMRMEHGDGSVETGHWSNFFLVVFFQKKLSIDFIFYQCQQLPLPIAFPLPLPIVAASCCCPSLLPVTVSSNFLHVGMEACRKEHGNGRIRE